MMAGPSYESYESPAHTLEWPSGVLWGQLREITKRTEAMSAKFKKHVAYKTPSAVAEAALLQKEAIEFQIFNSSCNL